jgi:hypothetical protein
MHRGVVGRRIDTQLTQFFYEKQENQGFAGKKKKNNS